MGVVVVPYPKDDLLYRVGKGCQPPSCDHTPLIPGLRHFLCIIKQEVLELPPPTRVMWAVWNWCSISWFMGF